jgi:hypothetical protein
VTQRIARAGQEEERDLSSAVVPSSRDLTSFPLPPARPAHAPLCWSPD